MTEVNTISEGCRLQYSGSMIFNNLPSGIKDLSNNVKSFKSALKNFLLANMFYMVDEFLTEKTKGFGQVSIYCTSNS